MYDFHLHGSDPDLSALPHDDHDEPTEFALDATDWNMHDRIPLTWSDFQPRTLQPRPMLNLTMNLKYASRLNLTLLALRLPQHHPINEALAFSPPPIIPIKKPGSPCRNNTSRTPNKDPSPKNVPASIDSNRSQDQRGRMGGEWATREVEAKASEADDATGKDYDSDIPLRLVKRARAKVSSREFQSSDGAYDSGIPLRRVKRARTKVSYTAAEEDYDSDVPLRLVKRARTKATYSEDQSSTEDI